MDKYLIVTVDDGGKIRDYRMTVEEADLLINTLGEDYEINVIHVSGVPMYTAEQVIKEWTA
jgi:hypothetical protein